MSLKSDLDILLKQVPEPSRRNSAEWEAVDRANELRRKVSEEILRSAEILRPSELAQTVDAILSKAISGDKQ